MEHLRWQERRYRCNQILPFVGIRRGNDLIWRTAGLTCSGRETGDGKPYLAEGCQQSAAKTNGNEWKLRQIFNLFLNDPTSDTTAHPLSKKRSSLCGITWCTYTKRHGRNTQAHTHTSVCTCTHTHESNPWGFHSLHLRGTHHSVFTGSLSDSLTDKLY